MSVMESFALSDVAYLGETDQVWLDSFGVDSSWHEDYQMLSELQDVINLGSLNLKKPDNYLNHEKIVDARNEFLTFVGIDQATLANFREAFPTLVSPDTFIRTQRTMSEVGLDARKIIKSSPCTIAYAPESIHAKVANLDHLGLDAIKLINTSPVILNLAPESVKTKVTNLKNLGLDAIKLINTSPVILNFAPESVKAKVTNLESLGLNAIKIISLAPFALNYAPESVIAKVTNLNDLGLNARKIINTFPNIIALAPESVIAKVVLIERLAEVLHWEYSAKELIEIYPTILSSNMERMQVLGRIAATCADKQSTNVTPKQIASALIVPLEQYVLAANDAIDSPLEITDFIKNAKKFRLSATERKDKATRLAQTGKLGRIGTMYLDYRK